MGPHLDNHQHEERRSIEQNNPQDPVSSAPPIVVRRRTGRLGQPATHPPLREIAGPSRDM